MATDSWPRKRLSVASLHLDAKNPRLGRETQSRAPRDIIQYLFEHDKALDVARSIATRGYFANEPLLAVMEGGRHVVVEGNRRLAALKALREPGVLEGSQRAQVERLARQIADPDEVARVPVTIAPNRRATDRQIAGKHIGTQVLPWQAENRASFILDKLAEDYTNEQLHDELDFSPADIQDARQTRAIADMARSLDLPEEVAAKLDNPRANLFTTLKRVFESSVGRNFLKVQPDPKDGFRITTTKTEFRRAFAKLVTDVALGRQSSRTLNTNENIREYFQSWDAKERPKTGSKRLIPTNISTGQSSASPAYKSKAPPAKKSKQESKTILPRDLKVRFGNDRLRDIRRELVKLERKDFPNCGAVMLRVFFELTVLDYLERIGELPKIICKLETKEKRSLPFGVPTMGQLVPEIKRLAKQGLTASKANKVEKAIRKDRSAPFTISELHGFVHSTDLPSERDIWQFWLRTEPLFRMMLEQDPKGSDE